MALVACIPATVSARQLAASFTNPPREKTQRSNNPPLIILGAAYFLFAMGYIAYMTFIVALLQENGRHALEIAIFWAVLGLAACVSPFLWGRLISYTPKALSFLLLSVSVGAA
jgi:predicted MFS family arabinose efflux permease